MIKQNKNTSAIWGRIASAFCACVLLFSLLSFPSFAYTVKDGKLLLSDSVEVVNNLIIDERSTGTTSFTFNNLSGVPVVGGLSWLPNSSGNDTHNILRFTVFSYSDLSASDISMTRGDYTSSFTPSTPIGDVYTYVCQVNSRDDYFTSLGLLSSYYTYYSDLCSAAISALDDLTSSATPNPDPLSIAPICDLTADSFNSSGYIFSYLTANPDTNRTIIGSYYDGDELVLVAGFLTSTQFFTVRSYNPSTSSNDLVYRTYNGELRSGEISTSLVPDGLNLGYRSSNRTSTTTQLGQVFSTPEDGFRACASLFESFTPASASAILLPYYESSNYLAGVNSNNQSVYFTSYYPNNAALAFFKDGSTFVPIIVGKDSYGVSSIINGTERPLTRYDISFNGSTYYGYSAPLLSSVSDSSLGYFSTESSAISACVNLLLSSFPSEGRRNVLYYMPSGNIAYVHVTDYSTQALLNVHLDNPISSSSLSALNMRYGWASDLPSGSLPSASSLTPIPWEPFGSTNLVGQYSSAQYSVDLSGHSGEWLVVYNPFQSDFRSGVIPDGAFQTTVNPDIMINVTNISGMKVYGLTQSLDPSTGAFSDTPSGAEWTLDQNSNGNVFTDSSGNSGSPVQGGGGNSVSTTNFWSWLNAQFESLKNLFATGHDTIQTLVGYGSDFMTSISNLYAWLPAPVYSVLCASLILVIIVGVVKVFL